VAKVSASVSAVMVGAVARTRGMEVLSVAFHDQRAGTASVARRIGVRVRSFAAVSVRAARMDRPDDGGISCVFSPL
jgi:hypothetical protein